MDDDSLVAQMPSPAAVSDANALAAFLSELQQLEALELFQFENAEQDGCTPCYYSIQDGQSAVKKRCVELERPARVGSAVLVRKKELTSTQRRRLEIDRLRDTVEQLQRKLERKKAEELQRRTDEERSTMGVDHGGDMWAHTATEVENGYLQEQIAGLQLVIDNVMSLLQQSTVYLQVRTRQGMGH